VEQFHIGAFWTTHRFPISVSGGDGPAKTPCAGGSLAGQCCASRWEKTMSAATTWTDRASVTGIHAAKVLAYTDCIKRTVDAAKAPGFDESGWDELASLLDTARFERVGNDKVAMGWDVYRGLLTIWGTTTDFWSEFRRVSEAGNRVFLELTEHNTPRGDAESVANSCTVYEFDDAGKIIHLDIYLQHD
jgi:hypothetical protein